MNVPKHNARTARFRLPALVKKVRHVMYLFSTSSSIVALICASSVATSSESSSPSVGWVRNCLLVIIVLGKNHCTYAVSQKAGANYCSAPPPSDSQRVIVLSKCWWLDRVY